MTDFEENIEQYELNGKADIEDIIFKHFPQYASKAREIKYDGIFANITSLPSSAVVTVHGNNKIEMDLHETDENHFDKTSGSFRLKLGEDGCLIVLKRNFSDRWKKVYSIKPS